ncbi:MAG: L,D-transpeptidase [Verrucomicrobiota bacterium]|jgi:lipoprotein-anchoring transpeptidase ErfK/SrfK|nr:L,D-transpeptidase [Verrucomicrobiota bacterium]MEE2614779.1 L,D-transpeptidase [Verrucomicrobiota bacterium]
MSHSLLHTIREACEQHNVSPTPILLIASVADQRLTVLLQKREWSFSEEQQIIISTSRFGVGQQSGSEKTPLGLHRIAEKFGDGLPAGMVFEGRKVIGTVEDDPDAAIAHRILWLEGLESGVNRGGEVDTHARYVYIHGVGNESTLGKPASRGCLHMRASDLIPFYNQISSGTLIWITESPLDQTN